MFSSELLLSGGAGLEGLSCNTKICCLCPQMPGTFHITGLRLPFYISAAPVACSQVRILVEFQSAALAGEPLVNLWVIARAYECMNLHV